LSNVKLSAAESSIVRVSRKWLRKYVAINEQVVNVSPTINHAHSGVDEGTVGVLLESRLTTEEVDVSWV